MNQLIWELKGCSERQVHSANELVSIVQISLFWDFSKNTNLDIDSFIAVNNLTFLIGLDINIESPSSLSVALAISPSTVSPKRQLCG